jgi:hypothetical protein
MTLRHYGCDFGSDLANDVVESPGATGLHVNVSVFFDTSTVYGNKQQTLRCLEAIKQAINKDTWPPV